MAIQECEENMEPVDTVCPFCGEPMTSQEAAATCPNCLALQNAIRKRPGLVQRLWTEQYGEALQARTNSPIPDGKIELPDVLNAHRYRVIDREGNKWYLLVSELAGRPVEIFASTAFDRDHELQSRIANLTTITRLISMVLRHLSLGEPLTFDKCLKQIQRSSRQKDDLPDMLSGVLGRYALNPPESVASREE